MHQNINDFQQGMDLTQNNIKLQEQESECIWAVKAIAIFTVFFAHMPWSDSESVMYIVFNYIGIMGVPIFLYLSGYLDYGSKRTIFYKIKWIFFPLLVYGSLTYCISLLIHYKDLSSSFYLLVINYLKWIFGCGSIYYFVPVLIVCTILGRYINNYVLIVLSAVSIYLSLDYIPHNDIITRYLNPFNFLIYYSLGRISRKTRKSQIDICKKNVIGAISVFVVSIVTWDSTPTYFDLHCVFFSMSAYIILMGFLGSLSDLSFLVYIGKLSFVIYLIHIQIAGFLNTRMGGVEYIKIPVAFFVTVCFVAMLNYLISHNSKTYSYMRFLGFKK